MGHLKFDVTKLERLNDPGRLETLPPDVMWQALGSPDPTTIVEIGAGTGLFAAQFVRLAPNSLVYAADIEPVMVEWMSENRPEASGGRLIPMLSEESSVPLGDRTADLVVMINLHHELAEKSATYSEAKRLLRSGGQLLAVDWAPVDSPKGPPLSVRASSEEAARVISAAGFEGVTSHAGLPFAWLLTARRP